MNVNLLYISLLRLFPVGNEPSSIAVNPSTNIVYVANYKGNTTSVIDGKTNRVTDTIPVGNSPDPVAVNPSTNIVYVANYWDKTIPVIDGKTNRVTATIPVDNEPSSV